MSEEQRTCIHVWEDTTELRKKTISEEKFGDVVEQGWVSRCVKCNAEKIRLAHITGKLRKTDEKIFPEKKSRFDEHIEFYLGTLVGWYIGTLMVLVLTAIFTGGS